MTALPARASVGMLDQTIDETAFVDHLLARFARPFGWRAHHDRPARTAAGWRTAVQGDRGFPDLVLTPGPLTWELYRAELDHHRRTAGETPAPPMPHTLYRECKTNTGRLEPDQRAWLAALDAAGDDAAVWRPRDYPAIVYALTFGRCTVRTPGTHAFTPARSAAR